MTLQVIGLFVSRQMVIEPRPLDVFNPDEPVLSLTCGHTCAQVGSDGCWAAGVNSPVIACPAIQRVIAGSTRQTIIIKTA